MAEERLGADGARRAVLYLAVFPMSLFLIAVYSESLFLLLALAAFVARRAGALAAGLDRGRARAAHADRRAGSAPCARCSWPGARPTGSAPSPAIVIPAGLFAGYPAYLAARTGDGWAFLHSQGLWHRHFSYAGPLGGIWDGLRSGWAGIEQLASGSHTHRYWTAVPLADSDPMRTAAINLSALAFLVLFVFLTVIAWRRFGRVVRPLLRSSASRSRSALRAASGRCSRCRASGSPLFPIFLALAVVGGRPRVHTAILAVSGILLGVAVSQWALWQWVA